MSVVAQKLITADEFFQMPEPVDGSKQELVKGVVVTMPNPGFRHGDVQLTVGALIRAHARANKLGRATVESGVRTDRKPDTVRGPDVAYWSYERLPADQRPVGYPDVAADLCVEVVSPSNRMADLLLKTREYLFNDVRMVWIVDPEGQTVTVYRQPDDGRTLSGDAVLNGEDVLPGFSVRVAELFE